jgi:hypothetical protein
MRVPNGIPLGCSLLLPFGIAVWHCKFRHKPEGAASLAKQGVDMWVDYILTEKGAWETGVMVYGLPTGFVGLALADLVQPWITWSPSREKREASLD